MSLSELRFTLRRLARSPAFTVLTILTLAVGIGANTAVFSVLNTVLLRPLPYPGAERLVTLEHSAPGLDLDEMPQSEATYLFYREHSRAFDGLGLFDGGTATLTGDGQPERLESARGTASLFELLAAVPSAGRLFTEDDERPGAPAVVLLSYRLWQRRYGGEAAAVGRTVRVDGKLHEIVGVLPRDFGFPEPTTELWRPVSLDPANADLGSFGASGIARLRSGVSAAEAARELNSLIADLEEAFPGKPAAPVLASAGFEARVKPYLEELIGDVSLRLWILLGTVGLVLLGACANVANLFLVRAEGRGREVAIRMALGAGPGRLVGAFLLESAVLAAAGGALGLLLAGACVAVLGRLDPTYLPRLHEWSIDLNVVAFTAGVSIVAALLFGSLPALRFGAGSGWRGDRGVGGVGVDRHRLRRLLVGVQVALALIVLVTSALMVRSFSALVAVDPGFRSDGVLSFELFLPENDYRGDEAVARFHQALVDRLRALPGVRSAGAASSLPLAGELSGSGFELEDFPVAEGGLPLVFYFKYVAPSYFEAARIPLLAGRMLGRADHEHRSGAVLVNASLAKHYWSIEGAVGKRLVRGRRSEGASDEGWSTIVGVVGDVLNQSLEEEAPELVYYPMMGPLDQSVARVEPGEPREPRELADGPWEARGMAYVLHTDGDPLELAPAVREEVWQLDANLPVAKLQPLSRLVSRARARTALTALLLVVAAVVALVVGSVGIYGVISYLVAQRTPEIGIRLALGADRHDVTRMVLRQGLSVAAAGVLVGLPVSLLISRWLNALLFEVSPHDPATYAAVPILLLGVALLASYLPARRAAAVAPVEALRHE